jgi:hypothetical protein
LRAMTYTSSVQTALWMIQTYLWIHFFPGNDTTTKSSFLIFIICNDYWEKSKSLLLSPTESNKLILSLLFPNSAYPSFSSYQSHDWNILSPSFNSFLSLSI